MRTIRNFLAVMLTGLAFAAFQVDADAQSRGGESRSTRTTRSASSSSNVNRSSSSSTQKKQSVVKPSTASRPSVQTGRKPSVQAGRPSSTKPAATRPSTQVRPSTQTKPSVQTKRPAATRPSVQTRPAAQNKPSVQARPSAQTKPSARPSAPNNRPQSGAVNNRKPSTSVTRPATRPNNRPMAGQNRPDVRPDNRPGNRPSAGSAYKPHGHKPPVKVYPNHKHDKPRVHPSHRDFIAYDRPSHFWTPHYHYFGHRVRVLPARARLFRHHGIAYYCYNDIWYRPFGGYYVICRPPFGTVLAANLIADMAWTAVRFSYYNTAVRTYRQINKNNEYIAEQNAIIAQNNAIIAQQNKTIAMNQEVAAATMTIADELGLIQSYAAAGTDYFYQDGVFYVKGTDGEYKVIVPPAGALVDSLPEDYEMVTLAGDEYYKVDDTVYKVTLNDGKPYFEVLGQMAA